MQQIGNNIYIEDSYLGVTVGGVLHPNGIIYVDAPLRVEDARSWRSALSAHRGGSNRILVNLDSHLDRILGSRMLDCTVIAQQRTAQVYRNQPTIFKGQMADTGAFWEDYSDAIGVRWALPDITFSQSMALYWGGPDVLLEHHPGPTFGASWVIVPAEGVIFVGDTVVVRQAPFLANADINFWLESLSLLQKKYKDFVVVAGRGGIASMDDIKNLQKGLRKIARNIDKLLKRGAPAEATESLVAILVEDLNLPGGGYNRDEIRLQYGLYQYYIKSHNPAESVYDDGLYEEE